LVVASTATDEEAGSSQGDGSNELACHGKANLRFEF
jgi:hypothetical protein